MLDNEKNNEIILPNSSDSIINADYNSTRNNDKNLTSTIDIPSGESTYQHNATINPTENISLLSKSNNQTIDYGANDSSTTNTTIKK